MGIDFGEADSTSDDFAFFERHGSDGAEREGFDVFDQLDAGLFFEFGEEGVLVNSALAEDVGGEALGDGVGDEATDRSSAVLFEDCLGDLGVIDAGGQVGFEFDLAFCKVLGDKAADAQDGGARDSLMGEQQIALPASDFFAVEPCFEDDVVEGDAAEFGVEGIEFQINGSESSGEFFDGVAEVARPFPAVAGGPAVGVATASGGKDDLVAVDDLIVQAGSCGAGLEDVAEEGFCSEAGLVFFVGVAFVFLERGSGTDSDDFAVLDEDFFDGGVEADLDFGFVEIVLEDCDDVFGGLVDREDSTVGAGVDL